MLRTTLVRCGKKGTPDYWNTYALKQGWPQFRRFYEHSRHKGGYRFFYKDNTYRVNNYECGPKDMDVFLTKDHYDYGTAGEICRLPKIIARKLIHSRSSFKDAIAVHATPENIKLYSILKPELAEAIDGLTSSDSIPLKRLRMHLNKMAFENVIPELRLPTDTDITITPEHFARCLSKYNIGINSSFIEGLIVSGYENNQVSFKVAELTQMVNELVQIKVLLDREYDSQVEARHLLLPVKIIAAPEQ